MNNQSSDQKQTTNQIQLNIDPDKIESRYSDAVFINHNPFGFTFDFAQNIPQMKMMKIIHRVSSSPQHTKAFLNVLTAQVKNYEKQFGEITLTPAMQEQATKKPIGFDVDEKNK